MKLILCLSDYLIPLVMFYIVCLGLAMKRPVYEDFVRGAKEGVRTVAGILPTLVGLMAGVGVLRTSGLLDALTALFGTAAEGVLPPQLAGLTLVRLFSSSAAVGLLLDIFRQYGADSRLGLAASLMLSCTETVFYTMSVYFMAAGVKKTRHTLAGALVSTAAGGAPSPFLGKIL